MRFVLALDQGTTSSRTILFDENGSRVASAQREFKQYYPRTGWVEHDPEEIWESQRETLEEVLAEAEGKANQGHRPFQLAWAEYVRKLSKELELSGNGLLAPSASSFSVSTPSSAPAASTLGTTPP